LGVLHGHLILTSLRSSFFSSLQLHQGRIEAILADDIALHSEGKIAVERGVLPERLDIDESLVGDVDAHPITVTLRHLSEAGSNPTGMTSSADGTTRSGLFRSSLVTAAEEEALYSKNEDADTVEVVRAKYVVGCDGAHSWTRRQLGVRMIGDATNFVWGVMDCVPRTNFPDIRSRCAVHSASSGSVMVIPQVRHSPPPAAYPPSDLATDNPSFFLNCRSAIWYGYTSSYPPSSSRASGTTTPRSRPSTSSRLRARSCTRTRSRRTTSNGSRPTTSASV